MEGERGMGQVLGGGTTTVTFQPTSLGCGFLLSQQLELQINSFQLVHGNINFNSENTTESLQINTALISFQFALILIKNRDSPMVQLELGALQ